MVRQKKNKPAKRGWGRESGDGADVLDKVSKNPHGEESMSAKTDGNEGTGGVNTQGKGIPEGGDGGCEGTKQGTC